MLDCPFHIFHLYRRPLVQLPFHDRLLYLLAYVVVLAQGEIVALRTYTTNHSVFIMRKFMSAKISELIKVESLLPKFETHEKCWNEKKVRVKKLSASSSYRARLLAEKLSDCNEEV